MLESTGYWGGLLRHGKRIYSLLARITIWAPRAPQKHPQTWQHDAHGQREKCANEVIDGRAARRTDGDGCGEEQDHFSSPGDAEGIPHVRMHRVGAS